MAILLAVEIARLTVASSQADDNPALAARLAAGIPPSLVSSAMSQIGTAAATGSDPGRRTLEMLALVSTRAPLQPEPFLVKAALAERAGELDRAAQLLELARWRNPRSAAARYLLADVRFRQNEVAAGLGELAVLAQLEPNSAVQLVPALSAYARQPSARADFERMIRINPNLKRPLLIALAADTANTDLILALSRVTSPGETGAKAWQERLLKGFLAAGDYDRAYAIWQLFAGQSGQRRPLLFNGDFRRLDAPGPFNWSYTSTSAGFAEPAGDKLRVLYFGRADAGLAGQLLLLPAGSYVLRTGVSGSIPRGVLQWKITCRPGGTAILQGDVGVTTRFTVPASNCPAQDLALRGVAQESPDDLDIRIGPVGVEAVGR